MGFHANAMKTHFISAYSYYPKYNLSQNNQKQNIQTNSINCSRSYSLQPSFTAARPVDSLIRVLHLDPLLHFEKFTKDEYLRLSQAEIEKLRVRSFNFLKKSNIDAVNAFDDIHSVVHAVLKDSFDKFFGAGNYVVITLGRSLSTVGKALGYRIGEENVVNMPMSWARRFLPESTRVGDHFDVYRKILSKNEHIGRFLTCLDNIGLNKEKVLSSGKNYVIMDYCSSGDSLKGAEFLFRSDYVWGPEAKVYTVDILRALEKYDMPKLNMYRSDLDTPLKMDALPLLSKSFCASHLKAYAQINRALSLGDTEDAMNAVVARYNREEYGLMTFRMLDNAMNPKGNYSPKLKPCGEFSLSSQKVEPWHDYVTQAESDIRNDIQRIGFQLIKLDAMEDWSKYSKLRMRLTENYNDLTDYYNTYKSNPYSLLSYYESRAQINECLKQADAILKDRSIFAR